MKIEEPVELEWFLFLSIPEIKANGYLGAVHKLRKLFFPEILNHAPLLLG